MEKIDLFREHKDEYALTKEPTVVDVGSGKYLTVSGTGAPGDPGFREKVGALYGTAYTIKFASKKERGRDFKVGVLEGLWWVPGKTGDAIGMPKSTWRWKLLIRVPAFVTPATVRGALTALRAKGKPAKGVKLETMREGRAVQMLHVGPYADEPSTLKKMEAFARGRGLRFRGKHHEIYLSDPTRTAPARLRTILRHPVTATARATG